jgi:serine/threonine-protein kinase
MQDDEPLTLSGSALIRLLGDALHVGTTAAPLETPDWWQDPSFAYVPVSFIGRGGSGFVWKASRRDGRGYVALKLVPLRSDPVRLRQRWQDECAALTKIQHPNLVALIDHGQSPDGLSGWLAMEWIEGTCLARKLRDEGQLPFKEVLAFAPQIIEGLSALHGAGLVHRDIKPSNLLLEKETGRLVVADLGIALDLDADADARVTRTFEQPLCRCCR